MPYGLEQERVVRLRVPAADGSLYSFCSGYLVAPGTVLTAAHVLLPPGRDGRPAPGTPCQCRVLGRADWLSAEVGWVHPVLDVALVNAAGLGPGLAAARFARLAGTEPVRWTACGFPSATLGPHGRETEHLWGETSPLTLRDSGELGLTIESRPAGASPAGGSGWAGLSGAAVISDGRLVGIVTEIPAHFGGSVNGLRADAFWAPGGLAACLGAVAGLETVAGTEYEPGLRNLRLDLPAPPADFTGRADDLRALGRSASGATVVAQAVAGLGGVGKTALAVQYGHQLYREQSVDLAWWFSAQDPAVMYDAMAARYRAVTGDGTADAEQGAQRLRNWLQDCDHRWLVIFDNADSDAAVDAVARIMPRGGSGQTVITSRRQDWADHGVAVRQLGTLGAEDALRLLAKRAQRPADRDAELLAGELGGLALALEEAGTFIRKTKIGYRAYRDQLFAHPADVLGMSGTDRNAALVWRSSMSHAAAREPAARTLLGVLSYLGGDPIPRPLLDPAAVAGSPPLAAAGEFALARGLGELADYSLIALSEDSITIHRLIGELTRLQLAAGQEDDVHAYAAVLLLTALLPRLDELRLSPGDLLGHILAATGHEPAVATGAPGVVHLLNTAAEYFLERRQLDTAKALNARARDLAGRYLPPDYPWSLVARADEARLTGEAGRVEDAIAQYRQLLADHIELEGPKGANVLAVLSRLADLAGQIGPVQDAIAQYRQLLGDYTQAAGEDGRATFSVRGNLARLAGLSGRGADAMAQYKRLVEDRTRALGADDPETLATRVSLARLTGEIGKADEAVAECRRLVADYTRVRGADHPDTLSVRRSLANMTGRAWLGDATGQLRQLVDDYASARGADDPGTLATRATLAGILAQAGRAEEALRQYRELAADQALVLGADHPDTLSARAGIARLTAQAGRVDDAIAEYGKLAGDYARVRGADHPDTLSARRGLANMTGRAGRFDDAIGQLRQLAGDCVRLRGADHPQPLSVRSDIARLTAQAGRLDEAIAEYRQLAVDYAMVRGADHPDTLSVRAWLARTSGDGGRFDDAVAQYQELAGDYARVLGADHRITLTSRANLAHFTGRAGRAAEACAQLGAVRDDRIRVFGPDDPGVISARKLLAYWRERPPGPAT